MLLLSYFARYGKQWMIALLTVFMISLQSASAISDSGPADDEDRSPVILAFSTVGDSRQDPTTPDPTSLPLSGQDKIWLQNSKAWSRIIRSIQTQKSDFLFFNGDMIMGYGNATVPANNTTVSGIIDSDLIKFYRQYAFWRGMVADLMETGTYVVPVPGNHETQCKACGKKAQEVNENAWRENMGDLILDDARFKLLFGEQPSFENVGNNGAVDNLSTDQSKLSYSFDFRGSHFAIVNTDPVGKDAHAPVNWLASDLSSAQLRGAQHFFVFGHKPAFTYYYGTTVQIPSAPTGLDNDPAGRDAFWDVIERYDAVYFTGHEHIFNLSQPRAAQGGKAWQVLVGSGGSPFEASPSDVTAAPNTDRKYAWATVKVLANGKVKIKGYGFNDQYGPTNVIGSVNLK